MCDDLRKRRFAAHIILLTRSPGPVHGDFNEQNILVRATADTQDKPQPSFSVVGCIDFGDVSVSCYVFDLAILVMSLLTMKNEEWVAACAISGYCSKRPLTELEWDVIYECVCARLCTSLTMGAYSISQDPGNEYLLTSAKQGWTVLASLLRASKPHTLDSWRPQTRS
ncbi:Aminoglycoside phosphotransferase [Trinorchestia longiramus]|nr:Aminoglycoside phosphotransferase [Trinorchestia longiramus]